MYQVMAIANYEDRFVIPTTHREYAENAFDIRGGCGFSFGNGCSDGSSEVACLAAQEAHAHSDQGHVYEASTDKEHHDEATNPDRLCLALCLVLS